MSHHDHKHKHPHSQQPHSQEKSHTGDESPAKEAGKAGETSTQAEAVMEQGKTVSASALELESLRRELAEVKDKYLRVLAESENARKRLHKEKQENVQYAIQNVIVDFLNPIDHMENALGFAQQMSDEVKHWAIGFQMILSQFKDILSTQGVKPFLSEGKPFDPHRHEAIEMIETSAMPPGIVIEESLKGYMMGDKTIRPARVKVSKAIAGEEREMEDKTISEDKIENQP